MNTEDKLKKEIIKQFLQFIDGEGSKAKRMNIREYVLKRPGVLEIILEYCYIYSIEDF